ncbi:cyanophycinase [Rugamonas sp. FT82W]|uniref:Cyanophycinase n=1 Tax=Duganella vulcania TaxID=2692166 RepID=A0A845G497_9BURK|nr:cyanophycinase [Duganella vulcania]MYM87548.1 cyanophycinase [Duganella vulcania]
MRRFCILLLAALAWCAPAGAADLAPQGSLVIVGGALRSDNAVVWQRIVQLAGGAGARIAVLPSAAANPEGSGAHLAAYLNHYGASAFVVPLAVRLANRDYRRDAEDATLARSIREAGGVYFSGGDQALITQALVRPDGSRSAVLEAIWDVYRRGGVIAGSSAGAAIMSSTMFDSTRTVFGTLAQGVNDGRELAPGLGFIGKDVFVDQHLLARGRFARMLPAMLKKGYKLGLGIDENTAMVINAAREVEVLGYQGALLLDLSQAAVDAGAQDFNISNVRISYLDRGDRYNLASRQFTPSADKAEGRLDPQKPAMRAPVYTADILGHNAVLVLMEKLIDNSQTEATGIATAAPGEARQELGFEFRFSRLADSIGYASATTEGYSILNLRLDVRPLHIERPWYK